jgi:succinate dehydrogenase / fumarate reductase flavoprotein subunit
LATLEEIGEVVAADLLIVGGGVGGLAAAIKAKEAAPNIDVLMVEKQTVGFGGKTTKIGGILAFLAPGNNADKFIDFQVRTVGEFLNDQEALTKYVGDTYPAIEQLGKWGAKFARQPDGKLAGMGSMAWAPEYSSTFVDIDMMVPLRATARKLGTRMLNKIHVVDLLRKDDRVIGATGFDIITGKFYIFKAKATLLANGSCGYKVRRFWVAGTGDGIAAAYRAGAQMRNAEFGNLYGHVVYQDFDAGQVGHQFLVNSLGENLQQKYMPVAGPAGVFLPVRMAVGLEKEIAEGRGPILFAPPPAPPGPPRGMMGAGLPKLSDWNRRMREKEQKYGGPPSPKRAIGVPFHGELSCIKVDHDMRTTIEGLWAIGDTSYAGSAVAGAIASPPGVTPGSGIMFAVVSAGWGGPSAARFAASTSSVEPDPAAVKQLKERIMVPTQSDKKLSPWDAIASLQDVMAPMKYSLRRSKERLEEGLARVQQVKDRLPQLHAQDFHYLSKCHEVVAMTTCAEMTFRAALMRTESRGFHFREDFPLRDDKSWLKWILLRQAGGNMAVSTEAVPIEEYRVKLS